MFNNWSDLLPTVKKAFVALGNLGNVIERGESENWAISAICRPSRRISRLVARRPRRFAMV